MVLEDVVLNEVRRKDKYYITSLIYEKKRKKHQAHRYIEQVVGHGESKMGAGVTRCRLLVTSKSQDVI